MNKRLPLLLSLLGVILLAASAAYWILQLYQPPQRPIAAVPLAQMPDPAIDAAASLFGGQIAVASATNYQLTGVVAGGSNSAAIIVAEGSPPKALVVGKEVAPGVTLAEVHPRYVMLSDNGVMKRIDLAPDTKAAAPMGAAPVGAASSDNQPFSNVNNGATPIMAPPANAPTGAAVAEPPMAPGAVQQQMPVTPAEAGSQQQNPNVAPVNNPNNPNIQNNPNNPNNPNAVNPANQPPAPVQMPPPTRAVNPGAVAPAVR